MAGWRQLKNFREWKAMSQNDLSKLVNIPGPTLATWESTEPKWLQRFKRLCSALYRTPNEMLEWPEERHDDQSRAFDDNNACMMMSFDECSYIMQIFMQHDAALRERLMSGKIKQEDVDNINKLCDLERKFDAYLSSFMPLSKEDEDEFAEADDYE